MTALCQNHITEIPDSKKLPENEVNEETEVSTITTPSIQSSYTSNLEDEISEKVKPLSKIEVSALSKKVLSENKVSTSNIWAHLVLRFSSNQNLSFDQDPQL
ncbi:hypothetical protein Glove_294g82 [Diversispora epigaea]|uniref:Uncharacterized protein n=1 Tax=Diversispora epigaea TaxID=1348612 RepID=A0A397I0W7_9GLOM|nr:hypothetical protein Glove_294g82 [Diversispora epigaea]